MGIEHNQTFAIEGESEEMWNDGLRVKKQLAVFLRWR